MKKIVAIFMVLIMACSLCACANAKKGEALVEKGVALLHKQDRQKADVTEALQCFEEAAAQGNDAAAFLAGWTLNFEIMPKTSENLNKAYEYYEKCAESKAYARIAEGLMYIEGIAVQADEDKALALIAEGVQQIDEEQLVGNAELAYYSEALNLLGIVYLGSYTVEEDCEKAAAYFQKGADLHCIKSILYTGYMYLNGWGVETDYQAAMDDFRKAYDNGDEEAMYYMGYMYHEGLGFEADHEKAFECYLKAAQAGHIYSMLEVSSAYSEGDGVDADQELSDQWYEKAVAAGYAE